MLSLRNLSLWTKFNLVVSLVLVIFFILAAWLDFRQQRQAALQESVDKSRLIAATAIRTREYISDQLRAGEVTLNKERYGLIPVVASNRIGQETGQAVGYRVRQVSNRFRNPANATDPFEREVLNRFAATPGFDEYYTIDRDEGEPVLRYLRSFRAEQSCLECHGDPTAAPPFLRTIFPIDKDQAYHYRLGEVVGAVSVSIPLRQLDRQVAANLRIDLLHTGGIFLALIVVIGLLLRRTVTQPLASLVEAIATVEQSGRFSARLPQQGNDEIGMLTGGFNRMMTELERSIGHLEESERRFRLLTETAHDSIVSFLANGQIILFNRKAERLFGLSQAEAIGMRVDSLIHHDCTELGGMTVEDYLLWHEESLLQRTTHLIGRQRDGEQLRLEMTLSFAQSDGHRFYTAILREPDK